MVEERGRSACNRSRATAHPASRAGVQLIAAGLLSLVGSALVLQALPVSPLVLLQSLAVYAVLAVLVARQLGRDGLRDDFGDANRVTLLRAVVVAGLAGLIGHPEAAAQAGWWMPGAALLVLVLDGVDGWLARRGACASAFGARFDMELDAFFILVLAALVFQQSQVGAWVLLLGLMRYGFVLAAWAAPELGAELPPSRRRKTVCVVQVAALLVALAPPVPAALVAAVLAGALLALSLSFSVDVQWLLRHGRRKDLT